LTKVTERRREYLTERELAEMGVCSVRTLQLWRLLGRGPRYIKVGRAVRYRFSDVEGWLAARAITPAAETLK
jgi:predicted DNA-binding transcriptional regulator AlpA